MTDEEARWRLWRILYRVGVILLLLPVMFYFGPNLIIFHKLTRPSPTDFVSIVETECVPTVRAMKEYQRDEGHLPDKVEDLVPKYLRSMPERQWISNGIFEEETHDAGFHRITYNFNSVAEGFQISGQYANGPIPVAPVTIGPATAPVAPPK